MSHNAKTFSQAPPMVRLLIVAGLLSGLNQFLPRLLEWPWVAPIAFFALLGLVCQSRVK